MINIPFRSIYRTLNYLNTDSPRTTLIVENQKKSVLNRGPCWLKPCYPGIPCSISFCSKKEVCFQVIGITQKLIAYSVFQMRVYFCIKIVLREKNIDFFVVIKNMIVGWEEMLKNARWNTCLLCLNIYIYFSVNFESEKIIIKSESLKRSHHQLKS